MRDNNLIFSIKQKRNKALLHAIKDYLFNLAVASCEANLPVNLESAVKIYSDDKKIMVLTVYDKYFLEFVLIPLFNGLT